MEFKKCERCGCFFISDELICCNCAPKDRFEISKLKSYFENNQEVRSVNSISIDTGISIKNLNRHLVSNELYGISNQLGVETKKQIKNVQL